MKRFSIFLIFCLAGLSCFSQIRLIEVDPVNNVVTLKNFGGSMVDISDYRFCARFQYTDLDLVTVDAGNLNLAAGAEVTLSGWPLLEAGSDLGLYVPLPTFTDPSDMVDFTQWGSSGNGRESVAVTKGIWDAGDFLDGNAPYTYIGDGTQNKLAFWQTTASTETDFLAYSFTEQTGAAVIDAGNHTIQIEVANGTIVTNLVATFTLSTGASATVNSNVQVSGTTPNDFTSPVTYSVTAEDGSTNQPWEVTVTIAPFIPNTETDITAFSFTEQTGLAIINSAGKTIAIEVAAGTSLSALVATFTLSDGATTSINSVAQTSGVTPNDFSSSVIYKILAEDNSTFTNWTVNVTPDPLTDFLMFSFVEQTGPATIDDDLFSIAIEVAAGTDVTSLAATFTLSAGATAKIGTINQVSGTTANDFSSQITYIVTAGDGVTTQPWTVDVTVDPQTDISSFSFSEQHSEAVINSSDHIIFITVIPGTDLSNLVATFTLSAGATAKVNGVEQQSGITINNYSSTVTYTVTSQDGSLFVDWAVSVTLAPNTGTDFLSFSFLEQTVSASITPATHEILAEVVFGTNLTALVSSFTLSEGATASISGNSQQSGSTPNNFTTPVIYKVLAEDGIATEDWTIIVSFAKNSDAGILAFSFVEQLNSTVINTTDHTVEIDLNDQADITFLVATFELSPGATAIVESITQESGVSANDFSNPLVYCVTAEDGETLSDWTVTVSQNQITGIIERQDNPFIHIYPNPTIDFVQIDYKQPDKIKIIKLYDNAGKSIALKREGNNIDLQKLNPGTYHLAISVENDVYVRKIIKK